MTINHSKNQPFGWLVIIFGWLTLFCNWLTNGWFNGKQSTTSWMKWKVGCWLKWYRPKKVFCEVSAPYNHYLALEASFVCNPHQNPASLALWELLVTHVCGIALSKAPECVVSLWGTLVTKFGCNPCLPCSFVIAKWSALECSESCGIERRRSRGLWGRALRLGDI